MGEGMEVRRPSRLDYLILPDSFSGAVRKLE